MCQVVPLPGKRDPIWSIFWFQWVETQFCNVWFFDPRDFGKQFEQKTEVYQVRQRHKLHPIALEIHVFNAAMAHVFPGSHKGSPAFMEGASLKGREWFVDRWSAPKKMWNLYKASYIDETNTNILETNTNYTLWLVFFCHYYLVPSYVHSFNQFWCSTDCGTARVARSGTHRLIVVSWL